MTEYTIYNNGKALYQSRNWIFGEIVFEILFDVLLLFKTQNDCYNYSKDYTQ